MEGDIYLDLDEQLFEAQICYFQCIHTVKILIPKSASLLHLLFNLQREVGKILMAAFQRGKIFCPGFQIRIDLMRI